MPDNCSSTLLNKDITTVKGPCIIKHFVDCSDKMESDVAKILSTKWPRVKDQYHTQNKEFLFKPGDVGFIVVQDDPMIIIANCYLQEADKVCADATTLTNCTKRVMIMADRLNINHIYNANTLCKQHLKEE